MESVTEGLGFYRAALYLIKEEEHLLECKCISGFTPKLEDLSYLINSHARRGHNEG